MSKPLLVVVEMDESYLQPLEMKLAEAIGTIVDIEVISEQGYLEEFFSQPRTIDMLMIDEANYLPHLQRHNIEKTVILTEDMISNSAEQEGFGSEMRRHDENVIRIFKYLTLPALLKSVLPSDWYNLGGDDSDKRSKIIVVMSAEGGAGCTTIAMGVCAYLKQSLKKVLYINSQTYQNFHYYLKDKNALPMAACVALAKADAKNYVDLKPQIRNEGFDYLPPLPAAQNSLGVRKSAIAALAATALKSGDYNYVVVDVGTELSDALMPLLERADKVLIVTGQNEYSAFKLHILQKNVDCKDHEKFCFVCNRFDSNEPNGLLTGQYGSSISIDQYVEEAPAQQMKDVRNLVAIKSMQELAYALM